MADQLGWSRKRFAAARTLLEWLYPIDRAGELSVSTGVQARCKEWSNLTINKK
jgi:hypothetical protein